METDKKKNITMDMNTEMDMNMNADINIRPGRYRHFKGNEYMVLHIARHSETTEPMVVYQALYGDRGIWVRPASMWNETVAHNGKTVRRFEFCGED